MSENVGTPERARLIGGSLIVIDFSQNGNSARFRGKGWSGQEPTMVWGLGPSSTLRVPMETAGKPVVLEAEIDPCRHPPALSGQIVRVLVNGTELGAARLSVRSMIRCEIDPELIVDNAPLDIEFQFPGFVRPKALRHSGDGRALSGAFSFVRLYTKGLFETGARCGPMHHSFPVLTLTPPMPPISAEVAERAIYPFGVSSPVAPFLREGWDVGEQGFTWTIAAVCDLELPAPTTPGQYVLRLDGTPLFEPDRLPTQELTVLLDRIVIGQFLLDGKTSLVIPLPRDLTEGRETLPLSLHLPDATRPVDIGRGPDTRLLGLAVERIEIVPAPRHMTGIVAARGEQAGRPTPIAVSSQFVTEDETQLPAAVEAGLGVDPATLMRGFESLGDNCEFGIAQRRLGLEVLNLLRFGNAHLPDLMLALADDLNAANDPGKIVVELNDGEPREFVLGLPQYNLHWHTFEYEGNTDEKTVLRAHTVKLAYLRRKFFEGLRGGRKIYVIKRTRSIPVSQAMAVMMELARHGRATLLCVEPAPPGRKAGEVDLLMPGLMRGYVTRFAPDVDVENADPTDWLRVVANATLLNRGPNAAFHAPDAAE